MKGLKKTLAPIKARGSSPSLSSSSSASSSSTQFSVQQQQHFREPLRAALPAARGASGGAPEVIIRAVSDYHAQRPGELSVRAGDFLQLIGELWAPDGTGWFEAVEPGAGARGVVPSARFQVFSAASYQPSRPLTGPPAQHATSSLSARPAVKALSAQQQKPLSLLNCSPPSPPQVTQPLKPLAPKKPARSRQPLYGIVRYDFKAERADELQAKRGEAIILIAHSHQDWFVAKPIGRLGGPGLIPVSFVEVKDLVTGRGLSDDAVKQLIKQDVVPGVDEWKRAAAAYRGNSIPLGRFESPATTRTSTAAQPVGITQQLRRGRTKSHQQLTQPAEADTEVPRLPRSALLASAVGCPPALVNTQVLQSAGPVNSRSALPGPLSPAKLPPVTMPIPTTSGKSGDDQTQNAPTLSGQQQASGGTDGEKRYATVEQLRERYGLFILATVQSFHKEGGQYWFHLRAHFSCSMDSQPSGQDTTVLVLYRTYEDFFEFHASLLDAFPAEAGREELNRPSIFPKLPEPKEHVDELVCADRVVGLTKYLAELARLPTYIREAELFYEFLGPHEGDVELQEEPSSCRTSADEAERVVSQQPASPTPACRTASSVAPAEQSSCDPPSPPFVSAPADSSRRRTLSKKLSQARSSNALSLNAPASPPPPQARRESTSGVVRGQHRSNFSSSTAASATDSPTAAGALLGQTVRTGVTMPFVRIKVYQEDTSDVIAIRGSDVMTHAELLEKVRQRVDPMTSGGPDRGPGKLMIKEPGAGDEKPWTEVISDEQLGRWLREPNNRLVVLYTHPD